MKTKHYAILLLMLVSTYALHAASAQIQLSTPQGLKTGPSISYCTTTTPTAYEFRFSYTYTTCTSGCASPVMAVRGILKKNGSTMSTTAWISCDALGNMGGSNLGVLAIPGGSPDLNSYSVEVEARVFTPGLFWVPMPGGNATSPAITSITRYTGSAAVSNFYLETNWEFKGQAAQNPNNTTVPDICLALVDNTILFATGSTGTISNYYYEVAEVSQTGSYQGGAYHSQWYTAANFTPGWFNIGYNTPITFEHNKYYNIKLAVQGPCNSWDEKSIRIHVVPDLTGRFTLYNTTNTFQAISPSAGFNGWKGFICSGGTSVIKFDNTTFAANASTIYRVHITEYNPNTMQIIGTTHTTPILQASYFDGPDRTLQSILDLMPFTMQSLHYYQLRLEAGGTCKYDEGGVLWFVPLGTCKTDETGAAEETAKEESSPTGVEEVNALSDISLFPNPANSNLNIVTGIEGNINFTIYDLNGRLMQNGNFSMSSVVNVSSFASGVYQVELTTKDGNRINRKFIKQ